MSASLRGFLFCVPHHDETLYVITYRVLQMLLLSGWCVQHYSTVVQIMERVYELSI